LQYFLKRYNKQIFKIYSKRKFPFREGVAGVLSPDGVVPDGVVKQKDKKMQNETRNAENYFSLPHNPRLKERARELRKAKNLSEILLWKQLKNYQFKGYDFDRQKIIGSYIVDFYCTNCNVVIEIDGSSHNNKQEYDKNRDEYLNACGIKVIRIADRDVRKNLNGVMAMLSGHSALLAPSGTTPSGDNAPATPSQKGNCHLRNFSNSLVQDHSKEYEQTSKSFSEHNSQNNSERQFPFCEGVAGVLSPDGVVKQRTKK